MSAIISAKTAALPAIAAIEGQVQGMRGTNAAMTAEFGYLQLGMKGDLVSEIVQANLSRSEIIEDIAASVMNLAAQSTSNVTGQMARDAAFAAERM